MKRKTLHKTCLYISLCLIPVVAVFVVTAGVFIEKIGIPIKSSGYCREIEYVLAYQELDPHLYITLINNDGEYIDFVFENDFELLPYHPGTTVGLNWCFTEFGPRVNGIEYKHCN